MYAWAVTYSVHKPRGSQCVVSSVYRERPRFRAGTEPSVPDVGSLGRLLSVPVMERIWQV